MLLINPIISSTYSSNDVIFLLKDISNQIYETSPVDKEEMIQGGKHYSEMLPQENTPSIEYQTLFRSSLSLFKEKVAKAIQTVAEQILHRRGKKVVLVSLARGGTPIGILIKRYIYLKYRISLPHYSISIIRGRGIDENAIKFIVKNHPNEDIQFIDGWTGKGAIKLELDRSIQLMNQKYHTNISSSLAVLADPGCCANIYGTKEDFLIPNACLNATVSGLISRTVLNEELISANDFHGAKFYKGLKNQDVSNLYIDEITEQFNALVHRKVSLQDNPTELTWEGLSIVQSIQKIFNIEDINLIKPGVGETTRVLLRRVPWKILVRDKADPNIRHILFLANEKKVPVEIFEHMSYSCCGLIKFVK